MSANEGNRKHDRDQELQNNDRDKNQQSQNDGQEEERMSSDKESLQSQNPERLRDKDHRMDQRINDVQGEVSYDQNIHKDDADSNHDMENKWKNIESDYRKRYPHITDEDVHFKSGEFDSMTGQIAKRTNRNREDVNNEIRDWSSKT